jgi:glucokinase
MEYYVLPDSSIRIPTPEIITSYAREFKDPLALDVVNFFLIEYSAKYLTDLALITLPLGGVYFTGSVYT